MQNKNYATLHNLTSTVPTRDKNNKIGSLLTYPDTTQKRNAEGGLRTHNKYKNSKPQKPLLTIITVVYNGAAHLEQCILSILEQRHDNVEYIIIDGASTDHTLDIIYKYQDAIDYFISEPDDGVYFAMNKGLSLASGDAINFMNSDDYFVEDAFEKFARAFTNPKIKFVHSFTKQINTDGSSRIFKSTLHELPFFYVMHQSVFLRKSLFEKIGHFKTEYKIAADRYCMLLGYLLLEEHNFYVIQNPLVEYRMTGISSTQIEESTREAQTIRQQLVFEKIKLPQDFIFRLINPYERNSNNLYLEFYNTWVNSPHEKTEEEARIFYKVLVGLSFFLQRNKYEEDIPVLQDFFWFRFGTVKIQKKIALLIGLLFKKIFRKKQ